MLKKVLPLLALFALPAFAKPVLTVYTYDSFSADWGPGPVVKKAFEADCNCELKFVALEDGVSLLNRLRMEGKNSKADVVLDPVPYTPRPNTRKAGRLLGEHARRVGDPNLGGQAMRALDARLLVFAAGQAELQVGHAGKWRGSVRAILAVSTRRWIWRCGEAQPPRMPFSRPFMPGFFFGCWPSSLSSICCMSPKSMPRIAVALERARRRTLHSGFHGCLGSAGLGG